MPPSATCVSLSSLSLPSPLHFCRSPNKRLLGKSWANPSSPLSPSLLLAEDEKPCTVLRYMCMLQEDQKKKAKHFTPSIPHKREKNDSKISLHSATYVHCTGQYQDDEMTDDPTTGVAVSSSRTPCNANEVERPLAFRASKAKLCLLQLQEEEGRGGICHTSQPQLYFSYPSPTVVSVLPFSWDITSSRISKRAKRSRYARGIVGSWVLVCSQVYQ